MIHKTLGERVIKKVTKWIKHDLDVVSRIGYSVLGGNVKNERSAPRKVAKDIHNIRQP